MQKKFAIVLLFLCILAGPLSAGILEVISEPSGAEIIINHIRTGRFTPDTLRNLPNKELKVTVLLEEYRYEERTVVPGLDSVETVSFTQLSDFDTLAITGDSLFGILQLPIPPVETPYLVNEIIEDRENVILSAGIHHIEWDGGISYEPIDTFIEVRPARIVTVDLVFARRYGRVDFVVEPESAVITIDTSVAGIGSVRKPVTAGKHQLNVQQSGWLPVEKSFVLFPGQTYRDTIRLEPTPDRDGDGFHDTVDVCPEEHGIYDGCPTIQRREEIKRLSRHFGSSFLSAPFTVELAPVSIQSRIATDGEFRELISLFNDGPSLLNNYRGCAMINKLWISRGLFIGSIDGGYSFADLSYEKQWNIPLNSDSTEQLIYSDYENVTPTINIFSLGAQIGIQLHGDIVSFAVLTGYLYETITMSGITTWDKDGEEVHITKEMDNSSWNTTIRTSFSFRDEPMFPRLYGEMSFAPGTDESTTGWVDVRLGIIIPWWKK